MSPFGGGTCPQFIGRAYSSGTNTIPHPCFFRRLFSVLGLSPGFEASSDALSPTTPIALGSAFARNETMGDIIAFVGIYRGVEIETVGFRWREMDFVQPQYFGQIEGPGTLRNNRSVNQESPLTLYQNNRKGNLCLFDFPRFSQKNIAVGVLCRLVWLEMQGFYWFRLV